MADTGENGSGAVEDFELDKLDKKIIRQVEFYFGDYNMMRDTFMKEKIKENEGWFAMDVMLKFKRLSSICSEPTTILEALKNSNSGLLEIDLENQRIRRKPNREIPQDNEDYRSRVKARTVHVSGFQDEEDIDDINDFLSEFGPIEGIQLQRTPHDKKFKGSLFATFFKQEDADKFIPAPMVYYKCNEITKMLKSDFYKQQESAKKATKKRKSEDSQKEKKHSDLEGTVAVKVSGISDDTIFHGDVKDVFTSIDVHTIRFFDRLEKHGNEGYLIFQDGRPAETLLQLLEDAKGSRTVTIKSAQVEFSVPNEEETKHIQSSYIEARERMFGGRGKKQHGHKQFRKKKPNNSNKNQHGKKTTFDSDDDNVSESKRDAGDDGGQPAAKQAKTE